MCAFRSVLDHSIFHKSVTNKARYRYYPALEAFIAAVQETGRKRMVGVPLGSILFRAQLGGERRDGDNPLHDPYFPYPEKRMKPPAFSAKEGRVNPKGIPCLYLADNPQTAMAEVRPWIGARISLGHFRTVRELALMDCTAPRVKIDISGKATPELKEKAIWSHISKSFSEPVTDSDDAASYASTQVLAEVFRGMGCDGVKYRSVVGEGGHSYALFNLRDADLTRCAICTTQSVTHTFSEENRAHENTVLMNRLRSMLPLGPPKPEVDIEQGG